jgi:3-oxoacyl-[acyl-carrier protein] reductase
VSAPREPRRSDDESPVALVTGASKGIGRHLAQHLLGRGFRVVGCSRGRADWEAPGYDHVIADVADEPQVKALLRHVSDRHHRLDAAVNNAGAATMNLALLTPPETMERLLRVNVVGTMMVTREAVKLMRTRGYGRIVNFVSVALPLRLAGQAAYVAAKGAVLTLSQVLARELGPLGITVNVVGPAPTATDMLRGVPQPKLDALVAALPLARLGTLADVAHAVEFFLQPESSAITGQVLYLGGVTAA